MQIYTFLFYPVIALRSIEIQKIHKFFLLIGRKSCLAALTEGQVDGAGLIILKIFQNLLEVFQLIGQIVLVAELDVILAPIPESQFVGRGNVHRDDLFCQI